MECERERPAFLSEIFVSFQGEGAEVGRKHLFVRFAGCNLRCSYCDTPDSLETTARFTVDWPDGSRIVGSNPVEAGKVAAFVEEVCRQDAAIDMISLTGGEPLLQHRFISRWLCAHPPPRPCMLETNSTLPAPMAALREHIALVSADLKLPSSSAERGLWDVHRRFLEALRGRPAYVKIPVDEATDPGELSRGARMVAEILPGATLFIQPLTSRQDGRWLIGQTHLQRLLALATAELPSSRFLPQMHKLAGIR
jgi:organic radical activating enzyme